MLHCSIGTTSLWEAPPTWYELIRQSDIVTFR